MDCFLAAPPGLEEVAALELGGLATGGGVELAGELPDLLRFQLRSRVGSRLLVRLGTGSPKELRSLAAGVDWARFVRDRFHLEISGGGDRPRELERPVQAAIAQAVPGAREDDAGVPVSVRLHQGVATLSVNASGEHLHRRGWRQETGAAPLRENVAAGILRLAGWEGTTPLIDPMCGSGTFVIEAALLALRRSPSAGRRFACEDWSCWPAGASEAVRAEEAARELVSPPAPIAGGDRNAGALGVARRNAERAGVLAHLQLTRTDAAAAVPPATGPGLVVVNPPYGVRVGEKRELEGLYSRLGDALRSRFAGWTAAVLVADRALGERLALPSPRLRPLQNGGIPCTLLIAKL